MCALVDRIKFGKDFVTYVQRVIEPLACLTEYIVIWLFCELPSGAKARKSTRKTPGKTATENHQDKHQEKRAKNASEKPVEKRSEKLNQRL